MMQERDSGPYPEQEQEYRDSEGPQPCGQCECCEAGRQDFDQAMAQIADLRAENAALREERDHERHEKETVAESGQAMVRYLTAERDKYFAIASACGATQYLKANVWYRLNAAGDFVEEA